MVRQLAHEIKNPLGGLRGAAQLLERQLKDPALHEYTDPRLASAEFHVIASAQKSLEAAAAAAARHGVHPLILSGRLEGEARKVGREMAAVARRIREGDEPFPLPCHLLSGGETTVTVRQKDGRGGRAGEFALGCAIALQAEPGVYVLAADTDGIDGIEDNAGAIVTPDMLARASARGLSPAGCLDRNDAYNFFAPIGDLVGTGPTFTNVNDFRAVLVL